MIHIEQTGNVFAQSFPEYDSGVLKKTQYEKKSQSQWIMQITQTKSPAFQSGLSGIFVVDHQGIYPISLCGLKVMGFSEMVEHLKPVIP